MSNLELREKILDLRAMGMTVKEIAEEFNIKEDIVRNVHDLKPEKTSGGNFGERI